MLLSTPDSALIRADTTTEYSQIGGRLATRVDVSYESRWTTMAQ